MAVAEHTGPTVTSACTDSSIATWGPAPETPGIALARCPPHSTQQADLVLREFSSLSLLTPIFVLFAYLVFALWGSLGHETVGWLKFTLVAS